MFDYKGQNIEELEFLSDDTHINCGKAPRLFWVSEIYSIGKCLRDYAEVPHWLPLNVYTEHAPGNITKDTVDNHEIENNAYCHFVSSKKTQEKYKQYSNKPCYQYLYPIIGYRRKYNIVQDVNAKGTIVFPCHSIPSSIIELDIDDFCDKLNALPEEHHPVCICLHYHDINKGQHLEFIKRGFPVYTAGSSLDINYIDKFYDILKHFKYSMSNQIGSCIYFSLEMGIPFSIIGEIPNIILPKDMIMNGKLHRKKGVFEIYKEYPYTKEYYELFKGKSRTEISEEQRLYMSTGLGLDSGLQSKELNKILWKAFLVWLFSTPGLKFSFQYLKNKSRNFAVKLLKLIFR